MLCVVLPVVTCNQCKHKFTPRHNIVEKCPWCKSFEFDKPKKLECECRFCGASFRAHDPKTVKRCSKCHKYDPISEKDKKRIVLHCSKKVKVVRYPKLKLTKSITERIDREYGASNLPRYLRKNKLKV